MQISTLLTILIVVTASTISQASPIETTTTQSIKGTKLLYEKIANSSWRYHYKSHIVKFSLKRSGKIEKGHMWGDTTWRVISPNEMILEHPNGDKMIMTFDRSLNSFRGKDWDGTSVSGVRFTKE